MQNPVEIELTPDESGAVVLDVDEMQLTILGLEEAGQIVSAMR